YSDLISDGSLGVAADNHSHQRIGSLACDAQLQFALSSLSVGQDLIHPRIQRSSTVGRIAVARSVDNDDDARWLAQRIHSSFGSSVDVNPRFLGWLLLVIGAGPVELSIAQHNAALGENGTLQFCDSPGIGAHQVIARRRFEPGFSATRSAARPRSDSGFPRFACERSDLRVH